MMSLRQGAALAADAANGTIMGEFLSTRRRRNRRKHFLSTSRGRKSCDA